MAEYTAKAAAIVITVFSMYILIKRPIHFTFRDFLSCIYWVYIVTLLLLVFETDMPVDELPVSFLERVRSGEGINLIPFRTISNFIRYGGWDETMVNILGNVLIFIPYGMGIVFLSNRGVSVRRNLPFCILFPLFIETVQLFIGRNVDVDDIILNFSGSAVGVCVSVILAYFIPYFRMLTKK